MVTVAEDTETDLLIPKHVKLVTYLQASILQGLMRQNLDQYNIVKFYDWYQMNNNTGLVLELLDMSLLDYMKEDRLPLKDIRLIIQQVRMQCQKATLKDLSDFKLL